MWQSTNTLDFHSTQSVYISGPWMHSLTFSASSNPELDQSTVTVRQKRPIAFVPLTDQ